MAGAGLSRSDALKVERWREQGLLLLFALCVLTFIASIPLPRADGHLIGSDGAFYYAYLPSLLLDGDLDFRNQYERSLPPDHPARSRVSPTGMVPNPYPMGPALLWSPFFLIAHGLTQALRAGGTSLPADGYGPLYEGVTLLGSMLYGFMALWMLYRLAARWFDPSAAWAAAVLLWFAGNAVYYMVAEPSMAHMTAMFAAALFFRCWLIARARDRGGDWLGLGAAGGLMLLVRPADAVFLIGPFVDRLLGRPLREALRGLPARALAFAGAAILVFLPQALAWEWMYGDLRRSSYLYGATGPLFRWTAPRMLEVLFSSWHGLFTWHPIYAFAVLGLAWAARRDRPLALALAAGFLAQVYLIGAWRDWAQGDAFGGRMFLSAMPAFVFGLSALLEALRDRGWLRPALAVGLLLVLWNGLFMVQYRLGFIPMSAPLTFRQLVIEKFLLPLELLRRMR